MPKKITKEDVIKRFQDIYGYFYSYDEMGYVNMTTPIKIKCPIHGEFKQRPIDHLHGGCKHCGIERAKNKRTGKSNNGAKRILYGVCINDYELPIRGKIYGGTTSAAFNHWKNMVIRCYDEKYKKKKPSYSNCELCDEWKYFTSFKKWFDENYKEGYQLDKDILIKGNKLYSPETCCFVPQYINTLIIKNETSRGELPIGVTSRAKGWYMAQIHYNGKRVHLGEYRTINEAFNAYKKAKERYIKEVAQEYYDDDKITEKVYNALMNYEVEITD